MLITPTLLTSRIGSVSAFACAVCCVAASFILTFLYESNEAFPTCARHQRCPRTLIR